MSGSFSRARGGRVKVRLADSDRGVVAGLLEAVAGMLEPENRAGNRVGVGTRNRTADPGHGRRPRAGRRRRGAGR